MTTFETWVHYFQPEMKVEETPRFSAPQESPDGDVHRQSDGLHFIGYRGVLLPYYLKRLNYFRNLYADNGAALPPGQCSSAHWQKNVHNTG